MEAVGIAGGRGNAAIDRRWNWNCLAGRRLHLRFAAQREPRFVERMVWSKQNRIFRSYLRLAFHTEFRWNVEAFQRDVASFSKFHTQRVCGQNQRVATHDKAVEIVTAPALPIIGDPDIVDARLVEA